MNRAELETTARIKREELRGLLDEMTDRPPRPTRKHSGPFAQIAALLPPVQFPRRSRHSPQLGRGSSASMSHAEQKAVQTLAEFRARLDGIDDPLSRPLVANWSGDEISMLPIQVPVGLTEEPSWDAPPPIELMLTPSNDCITIHSVKPRETPAIAVEVPVRTPHSISLVTLVALFGVAFLVGLLGAYAVV